MQDQSGNMSGDPGTSFSSVGDIVRMHLIQRRRARTLLSIATLIAPLPALAVDRTYIGPAIGDWAVLSNWSPEGIPAVGDNARFVPNSSANIILNYNFAFSGASGLNNLLIDPFGGGDAVFVQSTSTSSMLAASEIVGDVNDVGSGVYFHTAGSNRADTLSIAARNNAK